VQDVVVYAFAVEGSHHDDRPAARLPLHDPRRLERRHPGTGEVDVDRLPVLVEMALLVRRTEYHRARDAGVVVQNVDAAESLFDLLEHLPHVFWIGDVALDEEGLVREAQVADEVVHVGLRLDERRRPPAGDHNIPAASRGLEGEAAPHPRSAAGDHDHLPGERGVRVRTWRYECVRAVAFRIIWLARAGLPSVASDAKRRNSGSAGGWRSYASAIRFRVCSGSAW